MNVFFISWITENMNKMSDKYISSMTSSFLDAKRDVWITQCFFVHSIWWFSMSKNAFNPHISWSRQPLSRPKCISWHPESQNGLQINNIFWAKYVIPRLSIFWTKWHARWMKGVFCPLNDKYIHPCAEKEKNGVNGVHQNYLYLIFCFW